jgi:hypothetical protein
MAMLMPFKPIGAPMHYDVVVVGGGTAGVAAAVGAAQCGAHTLLIERYGFLGGAATHSNVLAYCGLFAQGGDVPRSVVGGVGAAVLGHMRDMGIDSSARRSYSGNWIVPLNCEAVKIALDMAVLEAGVEVRMHTRLIAASTSDGNITSIIVADHLGTHEITAGAMVDASGDCNLAYASGAQASAYYPEGSPIAPASYPIRVGGVPRSAQIDKKYLVAAAATISQNIGRASIRKNGGIMTRLPGTDDLWWLAVDVVTDGLSSRDMTIAEMDGRRMAWLAVGALRANAPGFEHANLSGTGPQIGIRETRHVATRASVSEQDAAEGRLRNDGVGCAGWPMEIHHAPGQTEYRSIGAYGYFHVPMGAIQAANLSNLWLAGRTIGADPAAYASVRVMGTAFATGQAAGVGAAQQVDNGNGVDVDVESVRHELLRQGAVL